MKRPVLIFFVEILVVAIFLTASVFGCSASKRVTGVNNTFLEDVDTSAKLENVPFDHSWVAPDLKPENYNRVYIKRIRTDKLPSSDWEKSMSYAITSKSDYEEAATRIATYFEQKIEEQIAAQPNPKFSLAKGPGPKTLVIEIALTELEFSHPVARAGSLAVPVPGTGAALSAVTDPHVAFAARITDGVTGKLVATAADRKFPPMRILDLNKLTVESSPREVVALWSVTIAQALNGDGKNPITEERFSLLPW